MERAAEQAQMRRLAIKRTFLADQFFLITVIDFKEITIEPKNVYLHQKPPELFMFYGKKSCWKMLKKSRFLRFGFFRFFESGNHNFDSSLLELVSFCRQDQMPPTDANFRPLATLTTEKSPPAKNGPNVLTIAVCTKCIICRKITCWKLSEPS